MSERWRQIDDLFHAAAERAPHERAAFLDEACAGNDSLRREVESLLAADSAAEEMATAKLPAKVAAEMLDKPSPRIASGQSLNQYRILSPLGAGGMGEVFLAEDTRLHRKVAIKLLPAQFTNDPDRVRRFKQEALAISAFNHPNIITIHEIGDAPAGCFLVMEHVAGRTLRALAAEKIPLASLYSLGGQIARALGVAHAVGITHRDIKPENIMVRDDGFVKVLDFGLARLTAERARLADAEALAGTQPGMLLGTVKYMSPEQARGETAMNPTDVFALGVVLYELATGEHPFNAGTLLGVLQAITTQTPIVPSRINTEIPAALDVLLLRMLDKGVQARPTAQELTSVLLELERAVESSGGSVTATTAVSPLRVTARSTVGREREHAELQAGLENARARQSLLLCVAGEPGMGKTTLVEDFLTELSAINQTCLIARGRCSERLAGTEAYLPLIEALESLLRDDRDGMRARIMQQTAPTWYAQVASLDNDNSSSARLLEDVRHASQERMKRELAALLQTLTETQPLVLFFDDLHWADVSTIDLLNFLAGKFDLLRALIIVTYRPSDMLLARHPFLQIKPDLQTRKLCRELTLDFLSRTEIEKYLALEFPQHRFAAEFPQLIHAKTEGNPLFMADLARYLRDQGVLAKQSGHWSLARELPDIARELPESMRGMIERKIAQLSEDDHRLLTAASVQGYEFDSAVVAQALQLDAGEVEERLERLERVYAFVRLVREAEFPNRTLTLRYRFVHVLYQNALYGGLRATRRATVSAAVAQALVGFYVAQDSSIASELAYLFTAARDFAKAAEYFRRATLNAVQVLATQEAVALARRGLEQLQSLPDNSERQGLELALQVVLGNTLSSTLGFAAAEVGQTYERARELCRQLGDTSHLLPVLFGLCVNHWVGGQHRQALELGQEFLALAQEKQDVAVIVAERMVGGTLWCLGELTQAREHYERLVAQHDITQHRSLAYIYGQEPGVAGRTFLAWVLWQLGYPDQALSRCQEALPLAQKVAHIPTQANAQAYTAILHAHRREPEQVSQLAEAVIDLTTEHGLAQFFSWGNVLQGWARAALGQTSDGIEQMQRGLDASLATGTEVARTHFLSLLAETYGKAGQPEQGLAVLDEMQHFIEKNDERYLEAELYRLRGELLIGRQAPAGNIEQCFEQARAIARSQKAKMLELRAAVSQARFWRRQGKSDAARQQLTEVYGWFTEGFDTPDLQVARALLDSLQ